MKSDYCISLLHEWRAVAVISERGPRRRSKERTEELIKSRLYLNKIMLMQE
jgi:hypothetical protein